MDICKAVVQKVISEGYDCPCAIAFSPRFGIIEFSLDPDVWEEKEWPEEGAIVMLAKLRREDDGWRAKEARLWTIRDEATLQGAKVRLFNVRQVFDVTTGYLFSGAFFEGLGEILSFMTDDSVGTMQFGQYANECRPYLLEQFPALGSLEMQKALEEVVALRRSADPGPGPFANVDYEVIEKINTEWIARIIRGEYGFTLPLCGENGEMLEVRKLPHGVHKSTCNLAETIKRVPPDKLIVVRM